MNDNRDRKLLKEAGLQFLQVFPDLDEKGLEKNEKEFMACVHDILYTIGRCAEGVANDDEEYKNRFVNCYEFQTDLENLKKLIDKFQKVHHAISCLHSWSEYNIPPTK